ncbi:50S ribosomal protein L1 [Patescibacteria group bacterium]
MPRGKRYQEEKKQVASKAYSPAEAIGLLKKISKVKFDPSVEMHIRLNVDPGQGSQMVRGTVVLPAGTGKARRVAVFCTSAKEAAAKKAGAEVVGGAELIKQIKQKKSIDFDVAVAEPSMMKEMGQIAPILGPRGMMPNPKTETVTPNIGEAVKELKGGKIDFRMDNGGNIHQLLGKLSFDEDKLVANIEAFIDAVKKAKPDKLRSELIKKMVLSTSMGPSLRLKK